MHLGQYFFFEFISAVLLGWKFILIQGRTFFIAGRKVISISPYMNLIVLLMLLTCWPVEIQTFKVLKKHICYCVTLLRYNKFLYLHPSFCVSGWEILALYLHLLSFFIKIPQATMEAKTQAIPEELIFKKIQLESHILFCIFASQDPNFVTDVPGRTYTLYFLSLCRATSCLLSFLLNSLTLWYQHLRTT